MASTETSVQERVSKLLKQADDDVRTNDLHKASGALKEASQLDPNSPLVKNAWSTLHEKERSGDVLKLLSQYVVSTHDEHAGQRALEALQRKHLTPGQASQALHLLLRAENGPSALDDLTASLMSQNIDAKKEVASKLTDNPTVLFDQLCERGPESFRALAAVPLDSNVWKSKDIQKTAQQDIFRLNVAKLMDSDVHHAEWSLRAITRQLAIAAENVSNIIDDSAFETVLECLDLRRDSSVRSQALLAISKMLETKKEYGETVFSHFITNRVSQQTNDDLIVAFSAAAAVFPVIPASAAKLFMTDGFVQQLVPNLEKNSEAAAAGQRKSRTLEQAALELLSAACVDKACRGAVDRYCSEWLRTLSKEREGTHKALAALILAKINATAQEELTNMLANLVLDGDAERDQAVEGLAYTSLQPKIKEEIVSKQPLLKSLVKAVQERPKAMFGCLTVFSNLTAYRQTQTEEQKKMEQLKAYANASKSAPKDPLDNDGHVTLRAKKLLDADIVPALVACCKQTTSLTNITLIVHILLSLSREQKHRPKLAQQGAVRLLLQVRDRMAKTDKATNEASTLERTGAHALARILISTNPAHVFTSALPASSAVSALIPLLSQDQDSEQRDLLPTFEALLALTNLASMEDNSVRDLQIRQAWDRVEDLLFSSNTLVQRASVELVCNLMLSPVGVAKFADGSTDARRRLQLLLALADVEDLATRRAAGGALAMLTEWDAAVTAVLDKERGMLILLSMCDDEHDELRHRGFACILNIIRTPGEAGTRGVKALKDANGIDVLKTALRKTRNQEVLKLGVKLLDKVQT